VHVIISSYLCVCSSSGLDLTLVRTRLNMEGSSKLWKLRCWREIRRPVACEHEPIIFPTKERFDGLRGLPGYDYGAKTMVRKPWRVHHTSADKQRREISTAL
jgi:hypothetical protein